MITRFYKQSKNGIFTIVFVLFLYGIVSAQVSLKSPANNAVNTNQIVNLQWNTLNATTYYKLQLSTDISFSTTLLDKIIYSTQFTYVVPTSNTKYYWRVKANNTPLWSETFSFTIFKPSDLDSLLIWFKADTGIVHTNLDVQRWSDQSANSNHLIQNTGSSQPKLTNSISLLNNLPVIRFDGNDDFLGLSSVSTIRSVFILSKYTNTVYNYEPILGDYGAEDYHGYNDEYLFGAFTPAKVANAPMYLNTVATTTAQLKKPFQYSIISVFPTQNTTFGTLGKDRFFTTRNWKGDFAEIIAYRSNTNGARRNVIEGYLRFKYAPPVELNEDTIANVSNFCDSITISVPNRFVSYLWSTGDTTPSVKVAANKSYKLTVKDVFNNLSSDEINVFPYKRFNKKSFSICAGDTMMANLNLPNSYSFLWSTGATTSSVKIANTGIYSVRITDSKGCIVYDTLSVEVKTDSLYNSLKPLIPKNISLCQGEKIYTKSPSSFDIIFWSTGDSTDFTTINTAGQYVLTTISRTGCLHKDTANISIAGVAPTARIVVSPACQGELVNFRDSSSIPAGNSIQSWKWTFSDNSTSTQQNPSVTFPGLGLASASLKITTNVGCTDSVFKSFAINKKPIPSFYNLLSCAGNPTVFVDQTIANAASVTDWAWDFNGLGISNGIQNPAFRFPAAGTYNVRLKATNSNGCSDTITFQTDVNSSPVSAFSFDSVCGKTPVKLKFLATVDPPSTIPDINWGKWDFGDGSIETAIRNPQHEYATPGTYDVSLIVISSNQCADTQVNQVKVFNFPVVDFTNSQTQCVGKEIQFTDISNTPDGTPVTKWNWFFSGQGTSEEQNPRYTFNSQGNYTIQLTAKNEVGCTGTKLRSIAVSSPPTPAFTFSPQNGLPPLNVNYFNQSPVNGNYLWDYGDGSPLVEAYNPPTHIYTTKGTYPIKLVATDFRGCTDTLTKFILVDKAYLDGVMASISIIPNGDDFYKVQVSIINNSNIEITALGLSIQLGGGALIRENWTGSLLPGQTTVYLFTGEIKVGDNGQIPVICASIDNINNNALEDRIDNNTTCKEVSVGNFDILNIYPNPAYETINFGVMLPKDGRVNIRFIDILGQQMYSKDFDGVKGYNKLTISTMALNAAVYVAEVSFDGIIIREKFMRKDRK